MWWIKQTFSWYRGAENIQNPHECSHRKHTESRKTYRPSAKIYLWNLGATLASSPTKSPPPFSPKLAPLPNVTTLPVGLLTKIGFFAHCGDSFDFNIVFVLCSRFPPSTSWIRNIITRAKAASSLSDDPFSWIIAAERRSLYSFRWARKCFSMPPPN